MRRLERDRPSFTLVDTFTFKEVIKSASSPHVIIVLIMEFMNGMMIFGSTFFLPSIINELGFSPNKTQLLSVGPYATATLGECFIVWNISKLTTHCLCIQ